MTKAEASLWKYVLKGKRMSGYQFRRQRPIDQYIVDFVCLPLKLVIEVDGITHTYENAPQKDRLREERLNELGFSVIRFTDGEILSSINRVFNKIESVVQEIASLPPTAPQEEDIRDQ